MSRYEQGKVKGSNSSRALLSSRPANNKEGSPQPAIPRDLKKCIQQLEEAIQSVPDSEKKSYLQAVEKVPELVEKESNPIVFLRHESFNAKAAAKRRIKYWEWREKLFEERAFLPMNDLSGVSGALDANDLKALECGGIAILPRNKYGLYTTLMNRSRFCLPGYKDLGPENRIRATFYNIQYLMQHGARRSKDQDGKADMDEPIYMNSIQLVFSTPSPEPYPLKNMNSTVAEIFLEAAPIYHKNMHLVCCPPKARIQYCKDEVLPRVLNTLKQGMGKCPSKIHVHVDSSEQALRKELMAFGYKATGLPETLGGLWKYSSVKDWVDRMKNRSASVNAGKPDRGSISGDSIKSFTPSEEKATKQNGMKQQSPPQHSPSTLDLLANAIAMQESTEAGSEKIEKAKPRGKVEKIEQNADQKKKLKPLPTKASLASKPLKPAADSIAKKTVPVSRKTVVPPKPKTMNSENGMSFSTMYPKIDQELKNYSTVDKAALMEAIRRCADIVLTESNPDKYLRFHKGNAKKATKQLVSYWEIRMEIFGDKGFLPMDKTEGGPLGKESIEALDLGYFESRCDPTGRLLVLKDAAKLTDLTNTDEVRVNCLFYIFSQAMKEHSKCNTRIVLTIAKNLDTFKRTTGLTAVPKLLNIFPYTLETVHILCEIDQSTGYVAPEIIETGLPSLLRHLGPPVSRTFVHTDLHPSNVFTASFHDHPGEKLLDFLANNSRANANYGTKQSANKSKAPPKSRRVTKKEAAPAKMPEKTTAPKNQARKPPPKKEKGILPNKVAKEENIPILQASAQQYQVQAMKNNLKRGSPTLMKKEANQNGINNLQSDYLSASSLAYRDHQIQNNNDVARQGIEKINSRMAPSTPAAAAGKNNKKRTPDSNAASPGKKRSKTQIDSSIPPREDGVDNVPWFVRKALSDYIAWKAANV